MFTVIYVSQPTYVDYKLAIGRKKSTLLLYYVHGCVSPAQELDSAHVKSDV